MPTVELSKKDLEKLVGKKFSSEELEQVLLFVKGEIDKTEKDKFWVDVKDTNRPDIWGVEGIAQEIRARIGKEKGLAKLKTKSSNVKIIVDPNTKNVRPAVACAIVNDIKITENFLLSIISLQEKITTTFGRKRKEAAIGIYELNKLSPPIHFKSFAPEEKKFIPLDFKTEMNLREILQEHPKGKEFGHLIKNAKKYPVWVDSKGVIASLSPIINSEITGRVTEKTKDVFIEVSGFRQETVNTALIVMAQAFAMRGGDVKTVTIHYKDHTIITPKVKTKKMTLTQDYVNKICGMDLRAKQIIELLKRARYDAKAKGKKIEVIYPSYRQDILHQIDVVEDVLISFGFNNIEAKKVKMPVFGKELEKTIFLESTRDACVGLGLQEVLTFTLSSKLKQQKNTGLNKEALVEIANPVSSNWEVFRKNIFPELLEFLSKNKHIGFPQKIFEVGKTVRPNPKKETGVEEKDTLCICISDSQADYSLIKSVLDSVCNYLLVNYKIKELNHPSFEKEKSALIRVNEKKGFFGELNQKTLSNFGVETKTVVLEMEL